MSELDVIGEQLRQIGRWYEDARRTPNLSAGDWQQLVDALDRWADRANRVYADRRLTDEQQLQRAGYYASYKLWWSDAVDRREDAKGFLGRLFEFNLADRVDDAFNDAVQKFSKAAKAAAGAAGDIVDNLALPLILVVLALWVGRR